MSRGRSIGMKAVLFATIGILFSSWQGVPAQLSVPARGRDPGTTVTVKLRVRVIPTSYGAGPGEHGKYPKRISLKIPAKLKNQISAYGAAHQTLLAPKGWTGTAAQGADGSTDVRLYPHSGYSQDGSYVIYRDDGGCAGCAALDAAPYFPDAKSSAQEFGSYKEKIPAGLEIHRLSPHLVTFGLPGAPGITVRGVVFYSGNSDYDYARVQLALPRPEAALMRFLLRHYVAGFRRLEHDISR